MANEKLYCGTCGSPLYYGRKFKEHSLGPPCAQCGTRNPLSFRYCYRCGAKTTIAVEDTADETG